jgi:hypothetical protein
MKINSTNNGAIPTSNPIDDRRNIHDKDKRMDNLLNRSWYIIVFLSLPS